MKCTKHGRTPRLVYIFNSSIVQELLSYPILHLYIFLSTPPLHSGVGIATACTNPIDVVKTRMQLIDKGVAEKPRGMISTAVGMAKSEGLSGFTQGMNMAVTRCVALFI